MLELEARFNEFTVKVDDKENKTAQQRAKCPSAYTYKTELDLCWRLEKDKTADWLTAGWHCHSEGGHLLMFDSMAKIRFIKYVLVTAASGTVYIGATDVMAKGKFKWINGKSVEQIP